MLTSGVFLSTRKFCSSIKSNFFPPLIFFFVSLLYMSVGQVEHLILKEMHLVILSLLLKGLVILV